MVAVVQINHEEASYAHKRSAAVDAKRRNEEALLKNPAFFDDKKPILVELEKLIGRKYSITDRRFVNYRAGGGAHKPAIAIKIDSPTIRSSKLRELHEEIDKVNPNIIFQENVNTGSHIYLIQ